MIESSSSTLIQVQPSSSKLPLILVGLILMLTVGAGGVYLGKYLYGPKAPQIATNVPPTPSAGRVTASPTPDPAAGWKTYTNEEYGYSLKHPVSWTSKDEDHGSFASKLVPGSKVSVTTLSGDSSTLQIFFEGEFDHGLDPWTLEKSEDVTLDGRKAKKDTFWLEGNPVKWIIVKIDNFHDFRIEMQGSPDTIHVFDQILSTFKLLDASEQTPSNSVRNINYAPPAGWKTHTSPMGFTFSYSPTYSSPKYEIVKRQLIATDPNSIFSYCQIDLGLGDTSGIFIVSSYPGGSRRQHIMDLTALPFSSDAKISTQEAKLGNVSGLLVDFQDVDGSPPVPVTDHTAIFVKNNTTALIIHKVQVSPSGTDYWNDLLSSIKIDSNFSADLSKCQ